MQCEVILTCMQRRRAHFDSLVGERCRDRGTKRGDGKIRCWVHECAYRAGRLLTYTGHDGSLSPLLGVANK